MLYNLLASRPLVMLPTCCNMLPTRWQHVASMFAKWSLALMQPTCSLHARRRRLDARHVHGVCSLHYARMQVAYARMQAACSLHAGCMHP